VSRVYPDCAQPAVGRVIDTDSERAEQIHDRVTETGAPVVMIIGPAREPLRADFDEDVEPAAVVRTSLPEADFDITRLERV
jgi:hypothetical protein